MAKLNVFMDDSPPIAKRKYTKKIKDTIIAEIKEELIVEEEPTPIPKAIEPPTMNELAAKLLAAETIIETLRGQRYKELLHAAKVAQLVIHSGEFLYSVERVVAIVEEARAARELLKKESKLIID